jgi:hypothetical protein
MIVLLPGLGARTLSRQGTDVRSSEGKHSSIAVAKNIQDQNSSREIEGGYFNRHGQHGAANNAPGGLNNTAGPSNSALVHHSPALSDTDEYPGAASSSTVQGQENRDVSTYNSGATTSFDADAEMQTFLATGTYAPTQRFCEHETNSCKVLLSSAFRLSASSRARLLLPLPSFMA